MPFDGIQMFGTFIRRILWEEILPEAWSMEARRRIELEAWIICELHFIWYSNIIPTTLFTVGSVSVPLLCTVIIVPVYNARIIQLDAQQITNHISLKF